MNENAQAVIGGLSLLLITGALTAWAAIVGRLWQRKPVIAFSPRSLVPWTGLDILLLTFTYLASEIISGGIAHALAGDVKENLIPWLLGVQSVMRVVWFLFALLVLMMRGAYVDDLGADTRQLGSDTRSGLWMFLAAVLPVFGVQAFFTQYLEIPSEHPLLELTQGKSSLGMMILATIAAVGIAPWFEEFVFRVVFQGWLETEQVRLRRLRDPDASDRPGFAPLMIASALFAALHANAGPDPAAIFILSLFLGYAYRQTHRIWPSLVIHAGVNGWTMMNLWVMYLLGEPPAAG